MTLFELAVVAIVLVLCGFGVAWMLKDIDKQIKMYEERCESLLENENDNEE